MAQGACETLKTEWNAVWAKEDISRWDYQSQVVFNEIKSIVKDSVTDQCLKKLRPSLRGAFVFTVGRRSNLVFRLLRHFVARNDESRRASYNTGLLQDFRSKDIAEFGSGTGRISKAISESGGRTTLLDSLEDVLRRSKRQFAKNNIDGNFVVGAFPDLPIKSGRFDVVWNAGVIEHFSGDMLKESLLEMARVCRDNGVVITINPYSRSWLHAIGRGFMMLYPSFPYKDEYPITTLKTALSCLGAGWTLREYTAGFFTLFVGAFKRLSLFSGMRNICLGIFWVLSGAMCALDRSFAGPIIRSLDRFLSKIFGGYVLISVFTPHKKSRRINDDISTVTRL